MNEEFLDYWQSPANMPFPDSHKDLELWCNNAFLAGAAAMREKAAEVAELFDISYDLVGDELMRRGDAALEVAAAIRKLEV